VDWQMGFNSVFKGLRQYPTPAIPKALRKTGKTSNHDSRPPAEIQIGKA